MDVIAPAAPELSDLFDRSRSARYRSQTRHAVIVTCCAILSQLAACASSAGGIYLYDAGRDKQAAAAVTAWKAVDSDAVMKAGQANLDAVLAEELQTQDNLALAVRDQHLRVIVGSPLRASTGGLQEASLGVVVELNTARAANLDQSGLASVVRCSDFLECSAEQLGALFDRVVMNPPFGAGADIQHITHALKMLKPGGRLVALCANGPRQNAALRPLVDASEGD